MKYSVLYNQLRTNEARKRRTKERKKGERKKKWRKKGVAARSDARNIFAGIAGSNPARNVDVCVYSVFACCPV
jgi:hypothetical protein